MELGTTQDRKASLQESLLRGARHIWGTRCRRMDTWWFSSAGAQARSALRSHQIQRAGAAAARRVSPPSARGSHPAASLIRAAIQAVPIAAPDPPVQISAALQRMRRLLAGVNTPGDTEEASRGGLRATIVAPTRPTSGFFVTNDVQLSRIVAEVACVDRLDSASRNANGRARLPWF